MSSSSSRHRPARPARVFASLFSLALALSTVGITAVPAHAQVPVTITIVSGGGLGAVGSNDPAVSYSIQGAGGTSGTAKIATPNGAYAPPISPGSRWINTSGNATTTDTATNKTTIYSATFSLPVGYASPSITVLVMADNAATVKLNGTLVGAQTQSDLLSNFQSVSSFTLSTASAFLVGTNTLTVSNVDFGSADAVDFKATVTYLPPATQVSIETAADGSGAHLDAQNVAAGSTVTGYAIERDASDNFVANVAGTWSLTNENGGVVDTDLVPAGDSKSATFTGHATGTATIHLVDSSSFTDDSGTLTVVPGALASITISPHSATISAGDTQAYTAEGFDSNSNDLGDVTGDTTFSISPEDGSCSGASCGSDTAGSHTVTGTDGSASDTASLTVDATLTLTKTGSPDPVQELNPITYTLTAGNSALGDATNVVVTDNLPAGTTFDSVSSTQETSCSNTATTVTCPLGTLSGGSSATVTIIVQAPNVSADTTIENDASVSADNASTVNASADTLVQANTGGSTQSTVPPDDTVPLVFTTSTDSTGNGAPAVDGTDTTSVSLRVPAGGPGGDISLQELPCTQSPCSGPGSGPAPATSSVVLGNVVFSVVPPTGYAANTPFRATLLYDVSLNPTQGPIFYFKDGVTPTEIALPKCGAVRPRGQAPCLVASKKLVTGNPLTNGDWKVVVKLNSDPRMHK